MRTLSIAATLLAAATFASPASAEPATRYDQCACVCAKKYSYLGENGLRPCLGICGNYRGRKPISPEKQSAEMKHAIKVCHLYKKYM
jgi:hypothetical protein